MNQTFLGRDVAQYLFSMLKTLEWASQIAHGAIQMVHWVKVLTTKPDKLTDFAPQNPHG